MKPVLGLSLIALVALSACDIPLQYREGTSFDRAERDDLDCDIRALRQFPVVIEQYHVVECDTEEICNAAGKCRIVRDCEVITKERDVNLSARRAAENRCMEGKGYTQINLPNCPYSVVQSVEPRITTVMPRLTKDACVIRRDGGLQIVNLQRTAASQ